jgi:hypothetical protein
MATYGNSADHPTPKPVDLPTKRAIWVGLSFVLLLMVLIFVFFVAAGHIERRNYYQPSNQSPPTPVAPPARMGP